MTEEFCDKGTKEDPGCQSNCDQPGSGGSGGDVQKKVIGYYEAWAHDRKCQGMVRLFRLEKVTVADIIARTLKIFPQAH
jgi:hypothetical protein